jgi:HSP20 family protein
VPNLIVRDPFDMSNGIRQMVDRLFDDTVGRMGNPFIEEGSLPVDIYEKDGKLWVRASVPGFKEDEIDVQVHEGVLSITAKRSEEHEEQGDRWFRRERSVGSMSRRIALQGVLANAEVDATLDNGVLTLSLPLPEAPRPKQIPVKSSKADSTESADSAS